ncbi:MAG TPA: hypothetical protein VHE60_04555 [Pyrinomonadaceae bacterium]|nr:hypothetical protein [Pyrinomonadaceae bacterium]
MIGLISSTIFPSDDPVYWGSPRTILPSAERLEQTKGTIESLLEAGISEIILADNSGEKWIPGTEDYLKPATVHLCNQYQFQNKGISEILMLLSVFSEIPSDRPILKISGRYSLKWPVDLDLGNADLAVKLYRPSAKDKTEMSTRCYWVKNKEIFQDFLISILRELYGNRTKITGARSVFRIIRNSFFPDNDKYPYHDPVDGIEKAAARILERPRYKVRYLESLGIEGTSGDRDQRLIRE